MKYSINSCVRFSEVDSNNRLSIGKIIDYFQDCSNFHSNSLGVGNDYLMENNRMWILNSWQLEIKRPIHTFDKILVSTWPYEFKGACGRRNFTISYWDNTNDFMVKADSVWVMFDMKNSRIAKIQEEEANSYTCMEKLDMNYSKKKIERGVDYIKMPPIQVHKYEIDINKHMNNSWYVKLAEEYLESIEDINTVRVEYKKSAKLLDIINPFVCIEQERTLVELRSTEDDIYAIIEFGKESKNL